MLVPQWLSKAFAPPREKAGAPKKATDARDFDALNWDDLKKRTLPILQDDGGGDDTTLVRSKAVQGACFSRAKPTPVEAPRLVVAVPDALALIDLSTDDANTRPRLVEGFSGNRLPAGAEPMSHCYCGYQFGVFAGQLGDGAAISLGEVLNRDGERWEIQLKGAGRTHYSRTADGRKVLRSSLRELLASEAAHALGVATTRAAALVTSETLVQRDVNYDGRVIQERASILTRLAPSFLRFGSFEVCNPGGPSAGDKALLTKLLDHAAIVLGVLPPPPPSSSTSTSGSGTAAATATAATSDEEVAAARLAAFGAMVRRTAQMVASWMCVGFCHGVLNTDNMSILGLTLDYGPYGYMEVYDPEYVCNASDHHGMYAYHRQPEACKLNCQRLAEALAPLLPADGMKKHLDAFDDVYFSAFAKKMLAKLGLQSTEPSDDALLQDLLSIMERTGADWTATFRAFCFLSLPPHEEDDDEQAAVMETVEAILECCASPQQLAAISMQKSLELGAASALPEDAAKSEALRKRAEEYGRAPRQVKRAHDIALWSKWLARYVQRLSREPAVAQDKAAWRERMRATNPRVVLRNWIAQEAIDAASAGDVDVVRRVLDAVTHPYDEAADEDGERYALPAATYEMRCTS